MPKKLSLLWTHDRRVARLVMNSPQNLNALDDQMAAAFREVLPLLETEDLRAVVVSGEGRAFSAGGDLEMLRAKAVRDLESNRQDMLKFYDSFLGLRRLEVPLMCAVQGHAVGAGFCFSAACDVRVADESAQFAAPFTCLGLHPGMGGSYFLARSLGSEVARELMLTGRRLGAEEARGLGFLARVVPEGGLETAVEELLCAVLRGAPLATRSLIRSEREGERAALDSALAREAAEQAACYARPEFLEGIEALSQRRQPNWFEQK